MDVAPTTELLPKQPDNARLVGPWPFFDDITTRVCRYAGREASAALSVALYKSKPAELGALAALQSVYYEPFTYWDWRSIHPNDTSAIGNKRQLLWERERGFVTRNRRESYPSPQEAWRRLQNLINNHDERRGWVKRIAVAHWMTVKDVKWMLTKLDSLEALDLSDIPTSLTYKGGQPSANNTWPVFFRDPSSRQAALPFLSSLRWLGLPDFRCPPLSIPLLLLKSVLPLCTSLQTLSIRGEYSIKMIAAENDIHGYICDFIHGLTGNTPSSVTSLELRLSVPFLDRLLVALLAEPELNVQRIGIDLGAWVHMYPLSDTTGELSDRDIESTARIAARQARFKIYEEEHNNRLPRTSKWHLLQPKARSPRSWDSTATPYSAADCNNPRSNEVHGKPAFEYDFFRTKYESDLPEEAEEEGDDDDGEPHGSGCEENHQHLLEHVFYTKVNSLPRMLERLHEAGVVAASDGIGFYPLEPECQVKSTTPLHPIALLKSFHGKPVETIDDSKSTDKVYEWLHKAFNWRPVFDWDALVNPDFENEKYVLHVVHPDKQQQDPNATAKDRLGAVVVDIAKHFQFMRSAGIPVHFLIGRRNPDQSSLYWGWPYAERTWEEFLTKPFDAGLKQAAAHIDTLSVFYDLRNPLDEERLEEIDELQPYHRPDACCPRPICPWRDSNNCPFKRQWADRPLWKNKPSTQQTASKKEIGKASCLKLASNLDSCPLTGEYVDKDISENTTLDESMPETLHQLARRAAFKREVLGWQRPWLNPASQLQCPLLLQAQNASQLPGRQR